MEQVVFWTIWAALAVFMGYFYLHHAHGIRSFLRGTGTGLVALLLLHELGGWIGFAPEVNGFNLMQAGILGVPGVLLMMAVHFFLYRGDAKRRRRLRSSCPLQRVDNEQ